MDDPRPTASRPEMAAAGSGQGRPEQVWARHAAGEPEPPGGPTRDDGIRPEGAVAGLLAAVFFCWHAWAILRGYFWQDDFRYMYEAVTKPLGSYMFRDYGGHLMPGQFLFVWVLTHLAPMHYILAVLPLLALQLLGYVLLWQLLVRLFGHRWALLVPYLVVIAAPMIFAPTLWWAYALQLLPFQVAMFGALHAHVGYLQTGRRRYTVQAMAWTAAGLFCWEKALLIVPLIFGVTAVLDTEGSLMTRIVGALRRHRALWTLYGVLAAGYLVAYLALTEEISQTPLHAGDLGRLANRMIADTFLPGLIGGPWSVRFEGGLALAVPPVAVLVVTWLLVAAVVAGGLVVGGRRAVLAWLLLAGYLACSVLLVAVTRLSLFGLAVGGDLRYVADAVPVAALSGALAFLRPLRRPAQDAAAAGRASLRPAGVGVLALVGLLAVGACVSTVGMAAGGEHRQARTYIENARSAFARNPDLVLVDEPVPDDVMIWLFDSYRRTSQVFAPLRRPPRFDQPTGDLRILDANGVPRPVQLRDTVAAPPGPVFNCGYGVHETWVSVPLTRPASTWHSVIRISYFTMTPATATVRVGDSRFAVRFDQDVHDLFVVADGPIATVEIAGDPGTAVCVTQLVVGTPVPAQG